MSRWFNQLFGDLYASNYLTQGTLYPTKPFWKTILTEDEDLIRNYILQCYKASYDSGVERFSRMRLNVAAYAGLEYFPNDIRIMAQTGVSPTLIGQTPKITAAHIQRLVNEQVTAVLVNPSDIAVVPHGTDFTNGIQAETVKMLLDCLDQDINKTRNREILHRRARLCGESYRKIYFNHDKGPLDPTYQKRTNAGKKVEILLDNGETVEFERAIYQGEVDEKLIFPWDMGLDPKANIDQVQWAFDREFVPTDELRADYPDVADNILSTTWASQFATENMSVDPLRDHTLVINFYAKTSPYLPQGAHYRVTPDVILESGPLRIPAMPGSPMGNLPYERLTDLDIDGYLYGWSRIQNIAQLQNQFDNTLTLRGRNVFIATHPKWMVPKGACSINRLANKVTVVQYAGGVAPQLVTPSAYSADAVQYQADIKIEMDQTYGSNPIMRGETPQGVVANAALQFLDARAQEAMTLWQAKNDQFEIDTYTKRLHIASVEYDQGDQRIIRAVGEDQKWMVKIFDVRALRGKYEIRLAISSDLPKRKDALMQTVFQMSQIWPNLFPSEAVASMFKLGNPQKFLSAGTASWQQAERENYLASAGKPLPDPLETEDFIIHWKCHFKQFQMPQFLDWAPDQQKELRDHHLTLEYMMLIKARSNYIFAAKLQELTVWPLLLPLPPDMAQPNPAQPGQSPGMPAAAVGDPSNPQGGQTGATSAQKVPKASLNQQRFPSGQFGTAVNSVQ